MLEALASLVPSADVLVMAAAVADYAPAEPASAKLKESTLTIELKNPGHPCRARRISGGKDRLFGGDGLRLVRISEAKARGKEARRHSRQPSSVIGSQKTQATILLSSGETIEIEPTDKAALAEKLVEVARGLLERKGRNA